MDYNINASVGEIMQKEGYQTKVMKPEKKKELPIYQKRNRWCFGHEGVLYKYDSCLLYTSPSPRDVEESRMPSSA